MRSTAAEAVTRTVWNADILSLPLPWLRPSTPVLISKHARFSIPDHDMLLQERGAVPISVPPSSTVRRAALNPTEPGTSFYEHALRIIAEVEDARVATASLNSRPQGLVSSDRTRFAEPVIYGHSTAWTH